MPRPSSRDRILDALETQLLEEGHASVTLFFPWLTKMKAIGLLLETVAEVR